MVGVAAAPDVAAMAQDHARGDRAVAQRPGQPMGGPRLVADVELAVARVVDRAVPDVTAGERVDPAVEGQPLGRAQAGITGGELLVHRDRISPTTRNPLFWSLEVQPESSGH